MGFEKSGCATHCARYTNCTEDVLAKLVMVAVVAGVAGGVHHLRCHGPLDLHCHCGQRKLGLALVRFHRQLNHDLDQAEPRGNSQQRHQLEIEGHLVAKPMVLEVGYFHLSSY